MALRWSWSSRVGTLKIHEDDNDWEFSLFKGNALLIMLWEYKLEGEDMYSLYNFFADVDHLKNCVKECPQIFSTWKEISLDRSYFTDKELTALIKAFTKCNRNCTIVLN